MTFNPNYAELLGRELQRDRMREAERERLVKYATTANPSFLKKVWYILRSRWQGDRRMSSSKQGFTPYTSIPKSSHSI